MWRFSCLFQVVQLNGSQWFSMKLIGSVPAVPLSEEASHLRYSMLLCSSRTSFLNVTGACDVLEPVQLVQTTYSAQGLTYHIHNHQQTFCPDFLHHACFAAAVVR